MTDLNLSAELLELAAQGRADQPGQSLDDFLVNGLARIAAAFRVQHAALWEAAEGSWGHVASSSTDGADVPSATALDDVLAESSDAGQPSLGNRCLAIPLPGIASLRGTNANSTVMVLAPVTSLEQVDQWTPSIEAFQSLVQILRTTDQQQRRVERLQALLTVANSWYQIREMEPLLAKMAEVSTELMGAERATIFLWDRRRKQLVGRPALGVADREFRIPEDTGVVGRVLRTGNSERADSGDASIVQDPEASSDFQTRNLVCVPLVSQRGRTLGAFELLNKREGEFTLEDEQELEELAVSAAAAIENCNNYQSLLSKRSDQSESDEDAGKLTGDSPALIKLREVIDRVGPSDLSVLVLGENGTGKEVASRRIHQLSKRSKKPFLAVNCAALTKTLLESELFGHEKGAFTDAHESRAGKFEVASGGTLMLDEIGELPLDSQAKLLRVLEEQSVVRVGGTEQRAIDTRVIAATNRDLGAMVRERTFREDLFFRLNVVTLELPALRERGDDVILLAEQFLEEFCEASGRAVPRFTAAAKKRLIHHSWPGNVRELRNVMERLAFLSNEDEIDAEELPFSEDAKAGSSDLPLSEATRQFQADYIRSQIDAARGNMTEAARRLGLHRSNLYRKMGQLGLDTDDEDT